MREALDRLLEYLNRTDLFIKKREINDVVIRSYRNTEYSMPGLLIEQVLVSTHLC